MDLLEALYVDHYTSAIISPADVRASLYRTPEATNDEPETDAEAEGEAAMLALAGLT